MSRSQELLDRIITPADIDLAIELTKEIVRIPSVNGDEGEVGRHIFKRLQELGFEDISLDEVLPDRYNAIGVIRGSRPGRTFVLNGHTDTKPVCLGWDEDPFSGEIRDGRLYGHGVMDMKAAVASSIAAAHALKRSDLDFAGKVYVAAVADHMGQQIGAIEFFKKVKADLCILGEVSDNRIYLGHRGRYYFDITTLGRAAHTIHKYDALSAINKMTRVVQKIDEIRYFPELSDEVRELFGDELYTVVGRIYGGLPPDGPSMIPDRCTIRVDTRPQPGISVEEVQNILQKAIEEAVREDPHIRIEIVLADHKDWHWVDQNSEIVQLITDAARTVKEEEPTYHGVAWLGDTASFGKLVPTVIFGPGREPIYMPNEYLDLQDIEVATKVYALTAAMALDARL